MLILFLIVSIITAFVQPRIISTDSKALALRTIQPTVTKVKQFPLLTPKQEESKKIVVVSNNQNQDPITTETTTTSTTTTTTVKSGSWGVAKQVGEHSYTMQVGQDDQMASANEILQALNNYRAVHGKNGLGWSSSLADFAQSRANTFSSAGKLDDHAGFNSYFGVEDNIRKTGYTRVGENSSIGYKITGVHLIEWVFASDVPHNENQLNSSWVAVGIGVSGTAVDLVFAGN
jgi:uncharacterized protein YkwD